MIKESKYIIRRVIIGVLIALILSFISSCEVHAETYNQISNGVKYYTWDNGEYIYNGQSDEIHYLNNISAYYRIIQTTELKDNSQVLFPGQYLIEFYVYSTYGTMSDVTCYDLKSDFQNVNMTTGNWVSNEIKSQCVDLYKTTYNGWNAYRILYKFTYNGANTGADGITELRYSINSSPKDFFYNFSSGSDIGMSSSAIYDYDSSLVSQFNDYKQDQTIISQNGQIISGLDTLNTTQNNNTNTIINNNNQNTQEIIDNQNSNTDKQIESQQVCTNYNYNWYNMPIDYYDKYLNSSGNFVDDNGSRVSKYINVSKGDYIYISGSTTLSGSYCLYDENKTLLNCHTYINGTQTIQVSDNGFIRLSIWKSLNFTFKGKYCKNGNQAMNDSINDLNDNITDDSIPSDSESKINAITDAIKENQNSSIVQIATFFPQMLQLIINGMNTNCTGGYSLGTLYGTELTIPCINPVDYLGSFLWGVIDSILCLCYLVPLCKFLVNKYNDLTSMKNLRWQ